MQMMTRNIWALGLVAALSCLICAAPAFAAKRVALVIGNNAYENVPALQKAVNDSEAISQELAKLGFVNERGVEFSAASVASMLGA